MDQSYMAHQANTHNTTETRPDTRFAVNHAGPGGIHINRSSRIMSAHAHACYLSADQMLEHAQQIAEQTIAAAETGYQQACEQGYEAGIAQARQQITQDNVDISLTRCLALDSLQQDITALVLQTLQQMLGEIDAAERVAMLVRQALSRLAEVHGEIRIHVHPSQAASLEQTLSEWSLSRPDVRLQSIADPSIANDACRVSCSSGSVEASLEQQLATLEAALNNLSLNNSDLNNSALNTASEKV